ncbi:hypothetical protein V1504DRAFT_461071 [Lipomyces starkeyi]
MNLDMATTEMKKGKRKETPITAWTLLDLWGEGSPPWQLPAETVSRFKKQGSPVVLDKLLAKNVPSDAPMFLIPTTMILNPSKAVPTTAQLDGDRVLLSAKNLKTKNASVKLNDRYLGPFNIAATIGKQPYSLELSSKVALVSEAHTSNLRKISIIWMNLENDSFQWSFYPV